MYMFTYVCVCMCVCVCVCLPGLHFKGRALRGYRGLVDQLERVIPLYVNDVRTLGLLNQQKVAFHQKSLKIAQKITESQQNNSNNNNATPPIPTVIHQQPSTGSIIVLCKHSSSSGPCTS